MSEFIENARTTTMIIVHLKVLECIFKVGECISHQICDPGWNIHRLPSSFLHGLSVYGRFICNYRPKVILSRAVDFFNKLLLLADLDIGGARNCMFQLIYSLSLRMVNNFLREDSALHIHKLMLALSVYPRCRDPNVLISLFCGHL